MKWIKAIRVENQTGTSGVRALYRSDGKWMMAMLGSPDYEAEVDRWFAELESDESASMNTGTLKEFDDFFAAHKAKLEANSGKTMVLREEAYA